MQYLCSLFAKFRQTSFGQYRCGRVGIWSKRIASQMPYPFTNWSKRIEWFADSANSAAIKLVFTSLLDRPLQFDRLPNVCTINLIH